MIFLQVLFLLLAAAVAQAQTVYTPNLKLALPPAEPNSWGSDYNNNFLILDTANTTLGLACASGQIAIWSGSGFTCGDNNPGDFDSEVIFSGILTPPTITGNVNNYNPTGLADNSVLRISTDGPHTITGLVAGQNGELKIIYNVGVNSVTLANSSGSSSVANQFCVNADIILATNQGIVGQYDGTSTCWRAASGISGGGGGGQAADDDLTAIAALACTGQVVRTGTSTWTCRTATAGSGIGITNGDGVAGNPTVAVDSTVWRTTTGGTASGGNHDFGAATTMTVPKAAGAAPTADGTVAYDTTAEAFKLGINGSTGTAATQEYIGTLAHSVWTNRDVDSSSHPDIYWKFETFAGTPSAGSCDRAGQLQQNTVTGEIMPCIAAAGNPISIASFNSSIVGETDGTNTTTSTGPTTTQIGYASQLATKVRVWTAKNGSGVAPFATQPSNDGIELISDSASDTAICTVYGTTNGGDQSNVIIEAVTMLGTSQASSIKVDWGKIYVVQCASNAVGTITIREASGNVTIATIIAGQSYAANANTRLFNAGATTTKEIWIPAGAMSVSGACTDTEPTERTPVAAGPKRYTIAPADDNTCSVEFDFPSPTNWNAGTITVQMRVLSTTNQTTEIFAVDFAGTARSSGTQMQAHSTTGERKATCTFGAQTNDLQYCTTSPAITLNGSPVAGDQIFMRGQVDATATTYAPTSVWTELHILGALVTITLL